MSYDALLRRIGDLEADNARLRRLLERHGPPAGLRHQVRNTLAMMRAVVRQSAERFTGAEDYAAHLDARLDAVFRIQNTIANFLFDGVPLAMLVADELLANALSEGERLSVTGPDVILRPAAASSLALVFHELASNAIKFGALSASRGRITVSWTIAAASDGGPWMTIEWRESGVPDTQRTPARRGFGTELIEDALCYQLGGQGTFDFAPGGMRCTIRLPLTSNIGTLRKHDGAPSENDSVFQKASRVPATGTESFPPSGERFLR